LGAVEQGLPLQALVQLSGLRALTIDGVLSGDVDERTVEWRRAVTTLAQLPALDELAIVHVPDGLSPPEALQLTVLTRLTWLQFDMEDNMERMLVRR
jgi:hypothetical protein